MKPKTINVVLIIAFIVLLLIILLAAGQIRVIAAQECPATPTVTPVIMPHLFLPCYPSMGYLVNPWEVVGSAATPTPPEPMP